MYMYIYGTWTSCACLELILEIYTHIDFRQQQLINPSRCQKDTLGKQNKR